MRLQHTTTIINNYNMKNSRELKVGILAILCAVILYFGLNFLKGINIFSSTASYVGKYENVNGLTPQSPVYIKGYKVGLVESVNYDFTQSPAFTVVVSIDKNIQLPIGTEIALVADGLLGGSAIELRLPALSSESTSHQVGDTLLAVVVPGLFESLQQGVLAQLDSVLVQASDLVAVLNDEMSQGSLSQTLQNVERLTEDLVASGADLRVLTGEQLPSIITNIDSTILGISTVVDDVHQANLPALVGNINSAVTSVNNAMTSDQGTLGMLLNDKSLYDNLNTTLKDLDSVVLNVDSITQSIKARPFIQKKLNRKP
jgi:phospholipid/cholesterol/gamma-HCH transport system substrate-binding protein